MSLIDNSRPVEIRRATSRRKAILWEAAMIVLYPVVAFVVFTTIWQLWVELADVSGAILPPPSAIASQLDQFPSIWPELWTTIRRSLYGFAIAAIVGFGLAVAIVTFRPVARALYPLLISTQVVPKVAIAPLFLVWFGYGGVSTMLIVFLLAFFPIVINTTQGLQSTEIEKFYLARSLGATWAQTFVRIRIPDALPAIFAGLKLAALLAINGAVVAEFLSSTDGIGRVLQEAAGNVDLVRMFVAIGYLSIAGITFYLLVDLVERIAIPWHVSRRDPDQARAQTAAG